MKHNRNIESWTEYDCNGRWCICAKKKRGRFTLDELTEVAMQYDEDFYAVIIKAISDEDIQFFDDIRIGDAVYIYRATDFLRGGNE